MKTIVMTISIVAVIFMAVPAAFAASATQSDTTVTITSTGNEPDFEYDASPSVAVKIITDATAYAITTANMLTGTDQGNGLEFGTLSTSTGYAQREKTTESGTVWGTNGPEAPTAVDALPGSGWIWQGGDGS
jgi:hypothetical protein